MYYSKTRTTTSTRNCWCSRDGIYAPFIRGAGFKHIGMSRVGHNITMPSLMVTAALHYTCMRSASIPLHPAAHE